MCESRSALWGISSSLITGFVGLLLSALGVWWLADSQDSVPALEQEMALYSNAEISGLVDHPVMFIPNHGQWDENIHVVARTPGGDLFFKQSEVVIDLPSSEGENGLVRMRPYADVALVAPSPRGRLSTRVNYFVGADSGRWRSDIATHRSLSYKGVYPGVDWVFRSNGRHVVYDLEVAPGVDPSVVRLEISGVKELEVRENGAMLMALPDERVVTQMAPFIYQEVEGVQEEVSGGFRIIESDPDQNTHIIGFDLGVFDDALALVIDPQIEYSALVGGSSDDKISAIALTGAEEMVVVGSTLSLVMPDADDEEVFGSSPSGRNRSGLIYQLSADGDNIDYISVIGGSQNDEIMDLYLDDGGDIYITGITESVDFYTVDTPSGLSRVLPSGRTQAAFVAKLAPNAADVVFSGYFGGSAADQGLAIELDDDGNIYVAGTSMSTDLPTRNALYPTNPRGKSGFLLSLSNNAQRVNYATYLGGTGNEEITAMQVVRDCDDYGGTVFLAGYTTSRDFPVSANAFSDSTNPGGTSGFVSRIGPQGQELVFSTFFGGRRNDFITAMTLQEDAQGKHHPVIAGYTNSTQADAFPLVGSILPRFSGSNDAFVAKIDQFGHFVHFSSYLGGTSSDQAMAVAVDNDDYIYVAGRTQSHNFPAHNAIDGHSFIRAANTQHADGFVSKIDPQGFDLIYSTFFGGKGDDAILKIATEDERQIFIAGTTSIPADEDAADNALFPEDDYGGREYHFARDEDNNNISAGLNLFAAHILDTLHDSDMPRLELGYVVTYPEGDGDNEVEVTLVFKDSAPTGNVAGFSTLLEYDRDKLEFVECPNVVPNLTDAEWICEDLEGGFVLLGLYRDAQVQSISGPVGNDDVVGGVVFEIEASRIDGAQRIPLRLIQSETSAYNTSRESVPVRAVSGGILVNRPCNFSEGLTGDCDCSGRVSIREVQAVASAALDGVDEMPCMQFERTNVAIDGTDLAEAISYHLDPPATKSKSAYPRKSRDTAPYLTRVEFAEPEYRPGNVEIDLRLVGEGRSNSTVRADLYYNPEHFGAITAVTGPVAGNANKRVKYNLIEPGRFRILVYGINLNEIDDGVIGTITLEPTIDFLTQSTELWLDSLGATPMAEKNLMDNSRITLPTSATPLYEVNLSREGNGVIRVRGEDVSAHSWSAEYLSGTYVSFEAVPDYGWVLSHWSGDVNVVDSVAVALMHGPREVGAHFVRKEFSLALEVEGEGSILIDNKAMDEEALHLYEYESQVELRAQPIDGWLFEGWEGDIDSRSAAVFLEMNKDIDAVAVFRKKSAADQDGDAEDGSEEDAAGCGCSSSSLSGARTTLGAIDYLVIVFLVLLALRVCRKKRTLKVMSL